MTEQELFTPNVEAKLYSKIGKIINNDHIAHKVYDTNVVENVMQKLDAFERTEAVQEAVQTIVNNRQLIIEHFL